MRSYVICTSGGLPDGVIAVGACVLILLIVVFFRRRAEPPTHIAGRILITQAEAQRIVARLRASNDPGFLWGGVRLPTAAAELYFAISGSIGSGKTKMLTILLHRVVKQLQPNSGKRLLVADPKNSLVSILYTFNPAVRLIIMNPADSRSWSWAISLDVRDVATALEVAEILLPLNPKENQPFFSQAVRNLLAGVLIYLILCVGPGRWTFRDVILILEDEYLLAQVVTTVPQLRHLGALFEPRGTWQSIRATIAARTAELRIIAAWWDRASSSLSLADWVNQQSDIVFLGGVSTMSATVTALNRLLLARVSELILARPENTGDSTTLAVDEFPALGGEFPLKGIPELCRQGRGHGARLAIVYQTISDMRRIYGEHGALALLGQFGNKLLLRTEDTAHARFCAELCGQYEQWEKDVTTTYNERNSTSVHWVRRTRPRILESVFLTIPPATPENGISGYGLSPYVGGCVWQFHLPGAWVRRKVPQEHPYYPGFIRRPDEHQILRPFTAEDLNRLGLKPPP